MSGESTGLGMSRSDWGKVIVGWLAALVVFAFTWYSTTNSAIQARPTFKEVRDLIKENNANYKMLDENQRSISENLIRLQSQIEGLAEKVDELKKR